MTTAIAKTATDEDISPCEIKLVHYQSRGEPTPLHTRDKVPLEQPADS